MTKTKILALVMCAALAVTLAGCGGNGGSAVSEAASKAGDAVSRMGEDMSEAMSRTESFLEDDRDGGSLLSSEGSGGEASRAEGDDGGAAASGGEEGPADDGENSAVSEA